MFRIGKFVKGQVLSSIVSSLTLPTAYAHMQPKMNFTAHQPAPYISVIGDASLRFDKGIEFGTDKLSLYLTGHVHQYKTSFEVTPEARLNYDLANNAQISLGYKSKMHESRGATPNFCIATTYHF